MTEHRSPGDTLRGERIAASARSIDQIRVAHLTGAHKGQFTKLRDNAYCVIEIPLKAVANKSSDAGHK